MTILVDLDLFFIFCTTTKITTKLIKVINKNGPMYKTKRAYTDPIQQEPISPYPINWGFSFNNTSTKKHTNTNVAGAPQPSML